MSLTVRHTWYARLVCLCLIVSFVATMVVTPKTSYAQGIMGLPDPGAMVNLSPAYVPLMLTGLTIHPENPLVMDFIVSTGDTGMNDGQIKIESQRLIKYFLACLTIPENNQWVNLSPYEKQRIIPEDLGQTVLGRDMLAQDYLLKQLTASLIYPEKNLGKNFWDKVYAKAAAMYGTTQIPVNTFNKVWIIPDTAQVYEHTDTMFVVKSHLKVMLDEDYLSLKKHNVETPFMASQTIGSQVVRQIILPAIEQEVNTGKNFAQLRQIYNSMILAVWYKKNLKEAFLNQVYADKSKTNGVNVDDPAIKEKIYQQYLQAYKKGVFNYIKEEVDQSSHERIPRKYFSGGLLPPEVTRASSAQLTDDIAQEPSKYQSTRGVRVQLGQAATAMSSSAAQLVENIIPLEQSNFSPEVLHEIKSVNEIGQYKIEIHRRQGHDLLNISSVDHPDSRLTVMPDLGFRIVSHIVAGQETILQNPDLNDPNAGIFFMLPSLNRSEGSKVERDGRFFDLGSVEGLARDSETGDSMHGAGRVSTHWKNLKISQTGNRLLTIRQSFDTADYPGLAKVMGHSRTDVNIIIEDLQRLKFRFQTVNVTTPQEYAEYGKQAIAEVGFHPMSLFSPNETTIQVPGATGVFKVDYRKIPTGPIVQLKNHMDLNQPQIMTGGRFDNTFLVTPYVREVRSIMKDRKRGLITTTTMSGDLFFPHHGAVFHIWDGSTSETSSFYGVGAAEAVTNTANGSRRQGQLGGTRLLEPGQISIGLVTLGVQAVGPEAFSDFRSSAMTTKDIVKGRKFSVPHLTHGEAIEITADKGEDAQVVMHRDNNETVTGLLAKKVIVAVLTIPAASSQAGLFDGLWIALGGKKERTNNHGVTRQASAGTAAEASLAMKSQAKSSYDHNWKEFLADAQRDLLNTGTSYMVEMQDGFTAAANNFTAEEIPGKGWEVIGFEFGGGTVNLTEINFAKASLVSNAMTASEIQPNALLAPRYLDKEHASIRIYENKEGYARVHMNDAKEGVKEGWCPVQSILDVMNATDDASQKELFYNLRLRLEESFHTTRKPYYDDWNWFFTDVQRGLFKGQRLVVRMKNGSIFAIDSIEIQGEEIIGYSPKEGSVNFTRQNFAFASSNSAAMKARELPLVTQRAPEPYNGGIDLNSRSLHMESEGQKVNITFNPAMMAQFKRGDFSGVMIEKIDVIPINLMPLLGLKKQDLQLALR